MTFSNEDPDLLMVKETPFVDSGISVATPRRKSMGSPFINLVDEEGSDTPAQRPDSAIELLKVTENKAFGVKIIVVHSKKSFALSAITLTIVLILLYFDCVEIRNFEAAADEAVKDKDLLQVNVSSMDRTATLNFIDKFAYSPKQPGLGGCWRGGLQNQS
ncbi:hypothetical protein CRYUN_Cryun11dG0054200 [Craigia yunnanensis]